MLASECGEKTLLHLGGSVARSAKWGPGILPQSPALTAPPHSCHDLRVQQQTRLRIEAAESLAKETGKEPDQVWVVETTEPKAGR